MSTARLSIAEMPKTPATPQALEPSTFAERFTFGRLWQSLHGVLESDDDFAMGIDRSASSVSLYRQQEHAPPSPTVARMAELMGVSAGWLAFGGDAGAPPLFAEWLARQRAAAVPRAKLAPVSAYKRVSSADAAKKRRRDAS
ncbi:MAG: hypothetical protein HOQ26_08100 [Gemmatimonadaceae bacterium]|nr:hypothetical protein [Gemmatimonadaceae bacterium]